MDELLSILRAIDADKSDGSLLIAADWFGEHPEILEALSMDPSGRPSKYGVPGWFSRAWTESRWAYEQFENFRSKHVDVNGRSFSNYPSPVHELMNAFDFIDHHGGSVLTLPGLPPLSAYVSQIYWSGDADAKRFRKLAFVVRDVARRSGGVGCYIRGSVYGRTDCIHTWEELKAMPMRRRLNAQHEYRRLSASQVDDGNNTTLLWLPHPDLIEKGLDRYDRSFIRG